MVDVAVVGAGLAGLSAALTAAREGANVLVLERSQKIGGRAASHRKHGFSFNLGPHALYPKSQKLLKALGISVDGGVPPLTGYALVDDALIPMPGGPLGLLDESFLFSPADRLQIASAFDEATSAGQPLENVSLAKWLDIRGLHGRPRRLFKSLARLATYADVPDEYSAAAAIEQMQEGGQGVLYPDGGWQTIVDRLRTAVVNAGVTLLEGTPVLAIRRESHQFHVSTSSERDIVADKVILAVTPDVVRRVLPRDWNVGVLPAPSSAIRLAALDIGLSRLPNPEGSFVLALDRPLYLSAHSVAAKLAPDGGGAISVARYIKPNENLQPAQFLEEVEGLLDVVQPGWRPLEVVRQYLPSITVASSFPRAADEGLRGRPSATAIGVPGLYLAGDWVGGEGQLSAAALASGVVAGELAAEVVTRTVPSMTASG